MSYQVEPEQDLRVDLTRMPTRPKSGFVIRNVRSTPLLHGRQPRLPSRTAALDGSAALE